MKNRLHGLVMVFFILVGFASGQLQECFTQWDSNKDGKITLEEFPGGKENAEYFRLMDSDNNGFITREELTPFMYVQTNVPQAIPDVATKEALGKWERDYKSVEHQKGQLQAENKQLKAQVDDLNQKFAEVSKERDDLKKRVVPLETSSGYSNQQMQRENQALRKQIEDKEREIATLRNQVSQLRKQIEDKEREIATLRNQLSQKGEIIPGPVQGNTIENSIRKPGSHSQNMLMAEEVARLEALRSLATQIKGNWIAACSQNVDGQNKMLVIGKLEPTNLVGVTQLNSDMDFTNGMIAVPVQISRANIIESIRRGNPNMTAEDYQELRFMFPEYVSAKGYGSWTENGQKRLSGFYAAQLDARRKLIEHLRGFVIKSSSRMENFILQNHEVVVSIETTLLIGVNVLKEEIIGNAIAQTTIEISRPMFIYSMRKGLETNGLQLTPEEYQNFRNMLSQEKYQFTGKAAVQ